MSRVTSALDAFFKRVLEEHLTCRRKRSGDEEDETILRDFVDVLLDAQKEEDGSGNGFLDIESIKGVILVSCITYNYTSNFQKAK